MDLITINLQGCTYTVIGISMVVPRFADSRFVDQTMPTFAYE